MVVTSDHRQGKMKIQVKGYKRSVIRRIGSENLMYSKAAIVKNRWLFKRDTDVKNSLLDSGRRRGWDDLREHVYSM